MNRSKSDFDYVQLAHKRWQDIDEAAAWCNVCRKIFMEQIYPNIKCIFIPGTTARRFDRNDLDTWMQKAKVS